MTAWNDFVKKIYHEGHNKNPSYQFKQALKDASKRKSEMGSSSGKKQSKKSCMKSCKKSCRKMRGGVGNSSGIGGVGSTSSDVEEAPVSHSAISKTGGSRRKRKMRGGVGNAATGLHGSPIKGGKSRKRRSSRRR